MILSSLFSDHMILQRDKPIAIWGAGVPGETIDLTLGDETTAAIVDDNGQWRGVFRPRPANKRPTILTIHRVATGHVKTIIDILVGDVKVLQGLDHRLDENACIALSRWHFQPATKRGEAIALEAVIQIPFRTKRITY